MFNVNAFEFLQRPILGFFVHKQLITSLSKREVLARYRGSYLGVLWSLIHPIILLTVYTFVFSVLFKIKWDQAHETHANFAVVVFIGLIVFNILSECISRSPNLMGDNRNFVTKVVFPIEILPYTVILSSLVHFCLSFLILISALFISGQQFFWQSLLVPVILLPFLLTTIGIMWVLAALGAYIKDVGQSIPMLNTLLLFGSPIFYPLSIVPESFRPLYALNPLTIVIENVRELILFGRVADVNQLIGYSIFSVFIFYIGFFAFTKLRKGFSDVL